MSYLIDSGIWSSVFAVPTAVVDDHIKMCSPLSLKILLLMLRHSGTPVDVQWLSERLCIPAGDIAVDVKGSPAAGAEAANVVEQPRGECYYYARGNGSTFLDRMRMRTPTSQNLAGMATALAGCDLADVNMIVLTIDPCISCTER